jgi:1,4-dihydroxy-2-naphthoate octaprenyltransferase
MRNTTSFKTWLIALRLPSILLATSSSMMGSVLAVWEGPWKLWVSLLAWVTAALLQLIANLANDYGDFVRGAGVEGRVSQAGGQGLSLQQIRRALVCLVLLAVVAGLTLLKVAHLTTYAWVGFVVLGGICIIAAISYTMGSKPYAYLGLGDLAVFLFFGVVGVAGTAYIHTQTWHTSYLLPMLTCGCLSVAVLNLNNIRDMHEDRQVSKNTLVVRMGRKFAIIYQWVLLLAGISSLCVFTWLHYQSHWQWLFLMITPRLIQSGIMTMRLPTNQLSGVLQQLVLACFYLVVLFSVGILCGVYCSR